MRQKEDVVTTDHSGKMLRELERKANEYASKATQLSTMLEQAEQFLQEMPGKIKIEVSEDNSPYTLEFFRHQTDGWRLWYGVDQEGSFVTDASVTEKAAAAKLLPELVNQLVSLQTQRLSQVEDALEALNTIPFLRSSGEDGGK